MVTAFIIEDEPVMAECIALAVETVELPHVNGEVDHPVTQIFNDAVSAMQELQRKLPDLIVLDVMLTGPDGFTFLNELVSYQDTARIPVILMSTLDLSDRNLEHYGVVSILNKITMTPEDIHKAVLACLSSENTAIKDSSQTAEANLPSATASSNFTPEVVSSADLPEVPVEDTKTTAVTSLAELNRKISELNTKTSDPSQHAN